MGRKNFKKAQRLPLSALDKALDDLDQNIQHTMTPKKTKISPQKRAAASTQQAISLSVRDTISIPKGEYEKLLKASAELVALKALLDHQVLEKEASSSEYETGSEGLSEEDPESLPRSRNARRPNADNDCDGGGPCAISSEAQQYDLYVHHQVNENKEEAESRERVKENFTVILKPPLPVTHADVTAAIRGGALTQIYVRNYPPRVNVSFVRAQDARAFMQWAEKYPFFVAGQLTTVEWSKGCWEPPAYIRNQVENNKISRNILIRKARPNITEAVIRRDLDHIEDLAVISVKVERGNMYISTNSVGGALFAKSCLMSRAFYRGLWIGFYHDECAVPLPPIPRPRVAATAAVPAVPAVPRENSPRYNPFAVLTEDEMALGTVQEDEDEE